MTVRLSDELERDLTDRVRAEPRLHLLLATPVYGIPPYTITDGTVMAYQDGLSERLHRLLYRRVINPRIGERRLYRACPVWGCVNPHHWSPVRGRAPFAADPAGVNLGKGSCPQNHHYTEGNTYVWRDRQGRAHRACRTCRKLRRDAASLSRRSGSTV